MFGCVVIYSEFAYFLFSQLLVFWFQVSEWGKVGWAGINTRPASSGLTSRISEK